MGTSPRKSRRLGDYTNIPFEIFVVACSVVPFFVLAYFYPHLPDRVPLFLNLKGEVVTWGQKTLLSVFRVPMMAVLTQLVCLLMKYGTVRSESLAVTAEQIDLEREYLRLNLSLWDWFRCLVAFKMSASSLETVFLCLPRFTFLARPAFAITATAAVLALIGAIVFACRLYMAYRKLRTATGGARMHQPIDRRRVYGGLLYFNPSDSALFAHNYIFNFANKWAYVFIGCIIVYPLLVFLPE